MVGVEGAIRMVAAKVPRARPSSAKLTEGGDAATTVGAPRALKAVLISASPMAVVAVVSMKGAEEQQEGNLDAVLSMVVEKGANKTTAQRVQKGAQAYALPTEVGVAVSMLVAARAHRAALISARPTVAGKDACTPVVPRAPREAHHSAKAMVEVNVVQLKAARKVCMAVPNSVSHMEVGRGVW